MIIHELPEEFNQKIHNAMLNFITETREEKDQAQVALGILYLLTSFYCATNDPDWKEKLLEHVKQHVGQV